MKKQAITSKEVASIIKKNWSSKSFKEIGLMVKLSEDAVRGRGRRMGLPAKPQTGKVSINRLSVKEQVKLDKEAIHNKVEKADDAKKYKELLKDYKKLEQVASIKEQVEDFKPVKIEVKKSSGKSEATAFALASDWHVEQTVRRGEILHNNEYNLEIAEKRSKQFFQGVLTMVREAEQNVQINNLVLWLGGDFITGNIHVEFLRICSLGPAQAICFARNLLISGIDFLLKETTMNITIPYNHGNHARITDNTWKSGEEDNSLEYILYDDIAIHFKNEPRIKMVAPHGSVATVEVYGMKIGFAHGHHGFRYADGVGGLYIPVRKYIMRKFRNANYEFICIGHYHQYVQDSLFLCNGSMIGYDQYSDSCGFSFAPPSQTFFLIEEKRKCRTVTRPILFDD